MELQSNQFDRRILVAKAHSPRPVRMAGVVAGCILVLCCTTVLADDTPREQVRVINSEPTRTSYDWQVAGRASVPCLGSSCSRYYAPSASGTDNVEGAVLRLQRSDLTIVIAECEALPSKAPRAGSPDANSPQVPQQCKIPEPNSTVAAEFHTGEVKLYMRASGYDGPGDVSSETYSIRGILQPTSSSDPVDPPIGGDPSASSPAGDASKLPQPDAKADGNAPTPDALTEASGIRAVTPKSRPTRQETNNDYQSGPELLTYLSHELIDPRRVNLAHWKESAAKLVRPALDDTPPVSVQASAEPEAVPPAPEQAPEAQGPVNTALTQAPTASGPALSAPEAVPSAPQQDPLAQGPVNTALAQGPAASGPQLSAPASVPSAPKQNPLAPGHVNTALRQTPSASQPNPPEPGPVPPAQAQASPEQKSSPPVQEQAAVNTEPAPPVPTQAAPASKQEPQVQLQVASSAKPLPPAASQIIPASEPTPPVPAQIAPVQRHAAPAPETVPPAPIEVASVSEPVPPVMAPSVPAPAPSAPVQRQSAPARETVPPTASQVAPAPRSAPPAASQVTLAPRSAPLAVSRATPAAGSVRPPVRQAAPTPEQVPPVQAPVISEPKPVPSETRLVASAGGPAPSALGALAPAPSSVPPAADAVISVSNPASYSPALRKMNQKIAESDYPVQELGEQWAQFQKDCPEPTTDEVCLEAKSKVILSMQRVLKARIVLIDQKISILEAGPQDAFAQQEEDETKTNREKLAITLQRFPVVLASLDRSIAELKNSADTR